MCQFNITVSTVPQLHVQGTAEAVRNFDGAFETIGVSSPVTELYWRDSLEYVYAASADSVGLYKSPSL